MARGLKFWIKIEEGLYYPCSENKGADQLRGQREADLRLCFRICKNPVFSRRGSIDDYILLRMIRGVVRHIRNLHLSPHVLSVESSSLLHPITLINLFAMMIHCANRQVINPYKPGILFMGHRQTE